MSMDYNKVEYGPKKILKKNKILKFWVGTKNVRNPHILLTLAIFLVFVRSNFFPNFLKKLEVHIVSMDDDKVEYGPKNLKKKLKI